MLQAGLAKYCDSPWCPLDIDQEKKQGGLGVEGMTEDEFCALSPFKLTPGLTTGTELGSSRTSSYLF